MLLIGCHVVIYPEVQAAFTDKQSLEVSPLQKYQNSLRVAKHNFEMVNFTNNKACAFAAWHFGGTNITATYAAAMPIMLADLFCLGTVNMLHGLLECVVTVLHLIDIDSGCGFQDKTLLLPHCQTTGGSCAGVSGGHVGGETLSANISVGPLMYDGIKVHYKVAFLKVEHVDASLNETAVLLADSSLFLIMDIAPTSLLLHPSIMMSESVNYDRDVNLECKTDAFELPLLHQYPGKLDILVMPAWVPAPNSCHRLSSAII